MGKAAQQVILGGGDRAELPTDPEERRALAERLRNELGLVGVPEPADARTATAKSG
jgi:hypothetical protein